MKRLALPCATVGLLIACCAPAHAATAQWSCGADAVTATVAGGSTLNPVTAGSQPCADHTAGLPNTTDSLGLAPSINAKSAYAITAVMPKTGAPMSQAIGSAAGVEGLSLQAGDNVVLGADAVRTEASAVCDGGTPKFVGTGNAVNITLNGTPISLDGPLTQLTNGLNGALGALITIKLNEEVKTATGYAIRGAHITVLPALGGTPLADVIIAESRVSSSSACDPNADGNGGGGTGTGTGTNGNGTNGNGNTGSTSTLKLCPAGSQLDTTSGYCVIAAANSGGDGVVTIGKPFSGPSGGTVESISVARKKYSSPCLKGPGVKYVIVGTNKNDHLTGTNVADRMLGLGGNDALDGGRGNDCLDGGKGSDTLSGALGNDRLYGLAGNDHLNGGPGNDRLSAGSGNDTINTSFGSDLVFGGPGVDFINSATAGKPAKIDCGTGKDKVRINRNERKRLKGCETKYIFNDV